MLLRTSLAGLLVLLGGCATQLASGPSSATCSDPQPPMYPREAIKDCVEGYVTMQFMIGTNGCAKSIRVQESVPPGIFDEAARQSLATWQFDTDVEDGPRTGQQTIEFKLKEGTCDAENDPPTTDPAERGAG